MTDKAKLYERLTDSASRGRARADALAKWRDDHAKLIARLVSSKPERADWYLHPGELTHAEAMRYGELTENELHKLMQRYVANARKANASRPTRGKSRKRATPRRRRTMPKPDEIGF